MKRRHFLKALASTVVTSSTFRETSALAYESRCSMRKNERLWFSQPARFWNSEALHLGNGFLGASFWGGIAAERIDLTERTLWTGGPGEFANYNFGIKPGGKDHLEKVRSLIVSGEIPQLKQADELASQHFVGDDRGFGAFSSFGKLLLSTGHDPVQAKEYVRELDLGTGVATVSYEQNGDRHKRELFCSFPHRVLVIRFSSSPAGDQPLSGKTAIKLRWNLIHADHESHLQGNVLTITGRIDGNKRSWAITTTVLSDAHIEPAIDGLDLSGAQEMTILIAAATEYKPEPPVFGGADATQLAQQHMAAASALSYDELLRSHVKDYQSLYLRTRLCIHDSSSAAGLPTNERWQQYSAQPGGDPGFKVLYFNLGRYLLISSSRQGSLPNTLQGGWNIFASAPWNGNYQSNINLQLTYSGAASTGLLACHLPYIDWIAGLVAPGRKVAETYYGSPGWVSHSIGDIWGYASPGSDISWGLYPAGAAWHCHTLWEHYLYSDDTEFLQNTAYPVMKQAALFWLHNLVPFEGMLISAPSVSAEHGTVILDGKLTALGSSFGADVLCVPGNFQDIEIIGELLANTAAAARILATDETFATALESAQARLPPLRIGQYGQLQEWMEDIDSPNCNHRHISHTYAVWPAGKITPTSTPSLAAAARTALNMRGEARCDDCGKGKDIHAAGNWSLANRVWCWVRLLEAERANSIFTELITQAGFPNLCTFQHVPRTYGGAGNDVNNPDVTETASQSLVWQVDASMSIPGFMASMLLQVDGSVLHLLPALPKEFAEGGSAQGLYAPGALHVDLEWRRGRVTAFKVFAEKEHTVQVRANGKTRFVRTETASPRKNIQRQPLPI
jgi:alpha-L-fucosidase 2